MDIKLLKRLREETGASFADCKKALIESDNSYEKALELVNKLKADRKLKEGKNEQERIDKKQTLQKQEINRQEEEKKALAEKQEEANKNGIAVDYIRTKYISGDITLEEAIELQTQHLKEEQKRQKEAERKSKEEEQRIEKQKAEELKKLTQKEVRDKLKTESIGSEFITAISKRTDLDDVCREIVDLKVKFAELREQHQDSSGYAWLEESLLSITDWGRDVFEALCKDEDVHIRSALAKNPSLPEDLLLVMMAECGTMDEKLSALSNPSCPKESLITTSRDTENYSSSRLRKAAALNPNTPKEIVNKLLEDEYKWVREAAANNSSLAEAEIKTILAKADEKFPSRHTYRIKSSGYGMVEDVCGEISIDDVVQAILDGADSWSDHIYSDFYSYDDNWHEYGPTDLVDTVVYPDSSEDDIDVKYDKDDDIDLIGEKNYGNFIHRAQCWEDGSWIYNEFDLENEFKPECLIASDNMDVPGIISGYVYEDPETGEYVDIEGELEQSDGGSAGIDFYVNTKNGLDYCDDFCDMRDEMTEQDLDPESEDDVRKYLKDKYGAE